MERGSQQVPEGLMMPEWFPEWVKNSNFIEENESQLLEDYGEGTWIAVHKEKVIITSKDITTLFTERNLVRSNPEEIVLRFLTRHNPPLHNGQE